MRNLVVVRTQAGHKYAQRIVNEFENNSGCKGYISDIHSLLDLIRDNEFYPEETAIHLRTAAPGSYLDPARELKEDGFLVINDPEVCALTSHKVNTIELLKHDFQIPAHLDISHSVRFEDINTFWEESNRDCFLKKIASSGGKGVSRVKRIEEVTSFIGGSYYLQETFPFEALYRVVLINQKPVATFVDYPDKDYMASVCLNPRLQFVPEPEKELLDIAVEMQVAIGGVINFIDIFWCKKYGYALSEINTACNLTIHERKSGINLAKHIADFFYRA